MEGEEELSLNEILDNILGQLPEDLFLSHSDTDTLTVVETLTVVTLTIHYLSVHDYGGPQLPPRDRNLIEQAIGAAFQSFGDYEPYPHPFHKAAVMMRGIIQDHPFSDGNKRTGFMVVCHYLTQVGYPVPDSLPEDEVFDFCMAVSAGKIRDPMVIAKKLAYLWGTEIPNDE